MPKPRDLLMFVCIASAVEAYLIIAFAPQFRPTGGLGRLGFRLFLVNVALVFVYRWFIYPNFLSPLRKIPGPSGGGLLTGHGRAQFSKPPGEALRKWVNSIPNDGLLYFRGYFNREIVVPTTHETLREVLSDNAYDYVKPAPFVKILRRILGDGLILVEDLLPSFQVKVIRDLYPMFWKKSCELVNAMGIEEGAKANNDPRGFEVEFGEWCMRSTLDIIGIAGFGRDFNAIQNPEDELVAQYTQILQPDNEKLLWFALNVVLPPWIIAAIPWRINTELAKIQANLYNFALGLVKERRKLFADPAGKQKVSEMHDILSLLVASNDFTDHELANQVLTMMAAGHETTSSALSWATFLLSKYPDIQKQVREEVRGNLPSPDSLGKGEAINATVVDSLPMLNAVCNETTRLYPTVPVTIREAIKPTHLGGYLLPTDTNVLLVPWAINRSEHFWGKDAAEFKPSRWINEDNTPNNTGGSSSNYAQLTFLHGPRSCIGQGFAKSELKLLLAAVVGRYELELSRDEAGYFPAGLVTSKPEGGMWLRMKKLDGW